MFLHAQICLHLSGLLLGDSPRLGLCVNLSELLLGVLHAQVCLHLSGLGLLLGDSPRLGVYSEGLP